MKYLINSFVYYDAIDGSLKLDDKGKSDTQLSITANALLYMLIQNPGVITRDYVMQKVWDDNGLVSSNSNLNQYISLLRKKFRYYGIENIIVTIPKGRLEIDPSLKIELLDNNLLHPSPPSSQARETALVLDLVDNIQESSTLKNNHWMYTAWVLFAGAGILMMISLLFDPRGGSIKLNALEVPGCELFSTENMTNLTVKNSYIDNFEKVKNKLSLTCADNERFLFFYGDKLHTQGLGRTFLAQCAKNKDNPFSYCENYFYYSWK